MMNFTSVKRWHFILFGGLLSVTILFSQFLNMRYLYSTLALDKNSHHDLFSLAFSQSYGFFDDITNENWKLLQKIAVQHVNHKYPNQPLTHNPAYDKRKAKYFNSAPAWWQTVCVLTC
jgi:hypothetical protein